jgi:DNA-binding transcriptional LysR family regulator
MDRLKAMEVLAAAAAAGSLSGAGRRLNMPLATVSRIVSELEAHLKVRLLNRTTRSLALTEAGAAYVAAARNILEQVDGAERAAGGEHAAPRGELVITAPVVFGRLHVLPLVTHFLQDYSEIAVRLVLSDRSLHLLDDRIDTAFRIGPLRDSGLVGMRLGSVRRVTCASPAYLKARGEPASPTDLAAHDCVSFDAMDASARWRFSGGLVAVQGRLTVNTAEAAIDAAVAGLGITQVLSYQVEQPLEAATLRIVLAAFEAEPLPVHVLHAGQGLLPQKLRVFLDFAAPRLKARLTRLGEIAETKGPGE